MKKQYRVLITKDDNKVNSLLEKGWVVESVTRQEVSTGGGQSIHGDFCFVLSILI